jgi:hypothetical protein
MESIQQLQQLPAEHRPGTPQRLRFLYHKHVVEEQREQRFLILASFIVTFSLVRFITHSIRAHRFTRIFRNFSTGNGGLHLHHLVFGIVGLMLGGEISNGYDPHRRRARNLLATLFGTSTALTMDEFALWLNLQDVYWAKQGRESVEGRSLFTQMGRDTQRLWRAFTHLG